MNLTQVTNGILIAIATVFIMMVGKAILLPLFFAILIYFLIRSVKRFINRSTWIKKTIPSWINTLIATTLILAGFGLIIQLIIDNAQLLPKQINQHEHHITAISTQLQHYIGTEKTTEIISYYEKLNFYNLINPLLNSVSSLLGDLTLIIFYIIFLFLEAANFQTKLQLIFQKPNQLNRTKTILRNIEASITNYIGIKTFINFLSAGICFITLYISGIELPFLWASCIFLCNFIPVIGIFIAITLPTLYGIIQFGNFQIPFTTFFILLTIQGVIGNYLEPKLLGKSLNISPLVALVSLTFWGAIWGIAGMLISVPLTVIIIILLSNFQKTRALAILLSNTGDV